MEALTKSCCVAMVDNKLGTFAPKRVAYVSNRAGFSLSPNDKKGCNFLFPRLVQNKGIYPLHAVPSKTQMELDSLVLQAQPPANVSPKIIHVKFRLERICDFGEQFLVVGNDPMFGSWNPSNAVPMTWSEGHVWTVEKEIPAGSRIQFKLILKRKQGDIVWQPGQDRILNTWDNMNRITVCVDWDNAQFLKIKEEEQLTQPNEEVKIGSENQNAAENLGRPKEMLKPNAPKVLKKSSC